MNTETSQPPSSPSNEAPVRAARRPLYSSLALFLAGIGFSGYAAFAILYLHSVREAVTISGLRAAGVDIGGVPLASLPDRLRAVGDPALDETLIVTVGEDRVRCTRRDAGFTVDAEAWAELAAAAGRSGNPISDFVERRRARAGKLDLPVRFALDRARALEFLTDVKERVDRAPVDAHLDLEHHTVAAEAPGHLLAAYESLVPLEDAAHGGATRIQLPTIAVPASVKQADLARIDISTVLASWETHYSTSAIDSDRTYNLKVGAAKLDGHILQPHELFSFNDVVGDRTEKEGYRVAPVISGGELIDGLAGGMCQIASTLHAASFFAGLDIVSSTPHSRPSAYIPMGLDSTVVYPSTNLKLRNPFDFPIVMHYSVNQGSVRVELLGKKKVYKTVFEREIQKETAFGSSTRRDHDAPSGQRYVAQEGYPGYVAIRRRYLFPADAVLPRSLGGPNDPLSKLIDAGKLSPLKSEKWQIHYPSTEQINVVGSGPARMKKKDPPPSHHIPPVPKDQKPIGRIVR